MRYVHPIRLPDGSLDDGNVPTAYGELATAAELWGLVDRDRGRRALAAIQAAGDRAGGLPWTYSRSELCDLRELLVGDLTGSLAHIADATGRVLPDQVAHVLHTVPHLVDTWTDRGITIYSIAEALRAANLGLGYLDCAVEIGVELIED